MSKIIPILLVLMIAPIMHGQESKAPATSGKHRIVFELTTADKEQWNAALNNVKNAREALDKENTEVMVIAHGNGLGLLMAKENASADQIKALSDDGVVFAACQNTMKKKSVRAEDLLPFATTVDSGVAEVVRKQEAGWSYLKSGN